MTSKRWYYPRLMDPSLDPRATLDAELAHLRLSTAALLASIEALSDAEVSAPSLLPDWSRGHVLAHVARNADGILNLIVWAHTDSPVPMYASVDTRNGDIEAGSGLSAELLRVEIAQSAQRVDDALTGVLALDDASIADIMSRLVQFGAPRPQAPQVAFSWVPLLRRREVEVHHLDLALTYGPDDWPDDFVVTTLGLVAKRVAGAQESKVAVLASTPVHGQAASHWLLSNSTGPTLTGDQGELLAWLMGRGTGTSLRMSDDTAIPAPPPWS